MEKDNQQTPTFTQLTQMLELSDKDFKVAILKVCWNKQLQTFLQNMLK